MSELVDPVLVKVCEAVGRISATTAAALLEYRAAGLPDDELVSKLWGEFQKARAGSENPNAGLLHMAMSCYKLAIAEQKISELEDSLQFHREAINFMTELSELP